MIKYRVTINKKLFFWLIFAHSKKSIPKLQRQSRPAKASTPCDKYPYVMIAVSPTIGLNLCLYPFPLTMAMPLILCLITPNASSSWLDGWIDRAAEESLLSPRLEVIAIGRCVWGGPGSEIQFCAEIKLAKRLEIQVFGTHLKKVTNVRPSVPASCGKLCKSRCGRILADLAKLVTNNTHTQLGVESGGTIATKNEQCSTGVKWGSMSRTKRVFKGSAAFD